jgi:ubiquitin
LANYKYFKSKCKLEEAALCLKETIFGSGEKV